MVKKFEVFMIDIAEDYFFYLKFNFTIVNG